MARLITRTQGFCRWSDGATSALGAAIYKLWDPPAAALPTPSALAGAAESARCGRLTIDESAGRIELLPIHYVYHDGVIVGRTALGTKYLTWLVRGDVVFEVDESDGLFDWRSVVVRGTATVLRARGTGDARDAYQEALAAIRTLVPDAMTQRDPTPYRGFLFAITPREISGRQAQSR